MGSLQENDLNTLKEPVLSSSEFGPGFQFQFQNDKAGKKIMETLAPIFTETLRKIQFPRLNVFTGVWWVQGRATADQSWEGSWWRWLGSYEDWWPCRMFFQECLPTSLVTRSNQWPFNTATVLHPLEINPQSSVAMLINAKMINSQMFSQRLFSTDTI